MPHLWGRELSRSDLLRACRPPGAGRRRASGRAGDGWSAACASWSSAPAPVHLRCRRRPRLRHRPLRDRRPRPRLASPPGFFSAPGTTSPRPGLVARLRRRAAHDLRPGARPLRPRTPPRTTTSRTSQTSASAARPRLVCPPASPATASAGTATSAPSGPKARSPGGGLRRAPDPAPPHRGEGRRDRLTIHDEVENAGTTGPRTCTCTTSTWASPRRRRAELLISASNPTTARRHPIEGYRTLIGPDRGLHRAAPSTTSMPNPTAPCPWPSPTAPPASAPTRSSATSSAHHIVWRMLGQGTYASVSSPAPTAPPAAGTPAKRASCYPRPGRDARVRPGDRRAPRRGRD